MLQLTTSHPCFPIGFLGRKQLGRLCYIAITVAIGACQSHLPTLESTKAPRPRSIDVVRHLQCDLAKIVNYPSATGDSRLTDRIRQNPQLSDLLGRLADDHFVASAQISLEVTDVEGLTPSLSFMNAAATHVVGVGGQWNGTQDRSVTINYSIDLDLLKRADYHAEFCGAFTEAPGLTGDLGLADIVADGLLALDTSKKYNVYGNSGPRPLSVTQEYKGSALQGEIDVTKTAPPILAPQQFTITSFVGNILVAPQGVGTQAQGTVALTGVATLKGADGHQATCLVNWTGCVVPPSVCWPLI